MQTRKTANDRDGVSSGVRGLGSNQKALCFSSSLIQVDSLVPGNRQLHVAACLSPSFKLHSYPIKPSFADR